MAVQPSPHKCSLLMIKNKGCPAFKPLVYFSSSKLPFKNQSKIQSKNQSRNQSKFAFFIVFLIFSFQSRNQSRNFLKTTILLKKNGFQSQIEFVQKSIVRLNFFNRGAFGCLIPTTRRGVFPPSISITRPPIPATPLPLPTTTVAAPLRVTRGMSHHCPGQQLKILLRAPLPTETHETQTARATLQGRGFLP